MESLWSALGAGLFGLLVALVTLRGQNRTTKTEAADKFRDDLMQRVDQQDRQLHQCEEDHRSTRKELDELRRDYQLALTRIDEQTGNIRRLEEKVAQLQTKSDQQP